MDYTFYKKCLKISLWIPCPSKAPNFVVTNRRTKSKCPRTLSTKFKLGIPTHTHTELSIYKIQTRARQRGFIWGIFLARARAARGPLSIDIFLLKKNEKNNLQNSGTGVCKNSCFETIKIHQDKGLEPQLALEPHWRESIFPMVWAKSLWHLQLWCIWFVLISKRSKMGPWLHLQEVSTHWAQPEGSI